MELLADIARVLVCVVILVVVGLGFRQMWKSL